VAPIDEVPPLSSLDDAVAVAAWLFRQGVSGGLDPATVREGNRSVVTYVSATNKADLLRRIKVLERTISAYEQEREAARGVPPRTT